MTIKVLLADDHTIVRDGLKYLLDSQSDIRVIGSVSNGRDAVQEVREKQPHVVIMDIAMPQLNGIEAARQINEINPDTQIIILSMHATTEHVFQALQAGARGYLMKESAGSEVVNAVYDVFEGLRYLSREISDKVVDAYVNQRDNQESQSPLSRLSNREREVLQLVVEGKTSNEIADILALSPDTVKTYRSRLMRKLNIDDLPSLVKFAIQHGLTPLR
jgi:RNA polymerase sigma factor (sigma-70 family)